MTLPEHHIFGRTATRRWMLLLVSLAVFHTLDVAHGQGTFIKPLPPPKKVTKPAAPARKNETGTEKPTEAEQPVPATASPPPIAPAPAPEITASAGPPHITGPLQGMEYENLKISGQTVPLFGIATRQQSEPRLSAWVNKNGGVVDCVAKEGGHFYVCKVNGYDVALALIINSDYSPSLLGTQEYVDQSRVKYNRERASRAAGVGAMLSGPITLTCSSRCDRTLLHRGDQDRTLIFAGLQWPQIASITIRENVPTDVNYYNLGKEAEQLGLYRDAAAYYLKASQLWQSNDPNGHCEEVFADSCAATGFPANLRTGMIHSQTLAAYQF